MHYGSSAGKESACHAGDPSLIAGLGRSLGEGIGYPVQHSCTSLVPQMVKNLPQILEAWVWFLDWEDPLEEGMATHLLQYSGLENPMDRRAWQAALHGISKGQTWLSTELETSDILPMSFETRFVLNTFPVVPEDWIVWGLKSESTIISPHQSN